MEVSNGRDGQLLRSAETIADDDTLDLTTGMTADAWVYPTGGTVSRQGCWQGRKVGFLRRELPDGTTVCDTD